MAILVAAAIEWAATYIGTEMVFTAAEILFAANVIVTVSSIYTLQEQQRLVLSSTVVLAEVHNQRAHAQALPGFGHERRVSFSPASSRPSLRYLM